jgi:LuxR family transcriptional regulator
MNNMTSQMNIVRVVRDTLTRLKEMCDTGFATAAHIKYTRPSLLYQTYAQDWTDHYSENGFMLVDPVVHWGLMQEGTVQWADLEAVDPSGVLISAKAHGLLNGWTYSVGVPESRTIAGLTKSGLPFSSAEVARIIELVDALHEATVGLDSLPPEILAQLRDIQF